MCLFCEIVKKERPADFVYENSEIAAFKDIAPKAPTHILIVPKKHIASIQDLEDIDRDRICEIFFAAKKIAKDQKIDEGYKLVFNVGRGGGQIIDHLHAHLLGGWKNNFSPYGRKDLPKGEGSPVSLRDISRRETGRQFMTW